MMYIWSLLMVQTRNSKKMKEHGVKGSKETQERKVIPMIFSSLSGHQLSPCFSLLLFVLECEEVSWYYLDTMKMVEEQEL